MQQQNEQLSVLDLPILSDTLLFGVYRIYALEKGDLIRAQKNDHGGIEDRHWLVHVLQ